MSRVFIAELNDQFDLSGATERGELVCLSSRTNPLSAAETIRTFLEELDAHNFDPSTDWICLSGRTVVLCLLVAAVTSRFSVLPLLIFDARTGKYVERSLDWDVIEAT